MASRMIVSTSAGDVKWIGDGFQRNPDLIKAILREKLTEKHAQLFADPVVAKGSDEIDWYTGVDGTLMRFDLMNDPMKEQAREVLKGLDADIRRVAASIRALGADGHSETADILENALSVPSEAHIWIIKNENGPQPVLTCWGGEAGQTEAGGGSLRRPLDLSRLQGSRLAASGPLVLEDRPQGWLGWLFWALWLGVFVLFFLILALVISPCEVKGIPLLGTCPAEAQSEISQKTIRQVQNEVARLERELAGLSGQCSRSRKTEAVPG